MLENLSMTPLDPKEKEEENKKESYGGGQDIHNDDSAYETDSDGSPYDGITKSKKEGLMDTNPWGDDED